MHERPESSSHSSKDQKSQSQEKKPQHEEQIAQVPKGSLDEIESDLLEIAVDKEKTQKVLETQRNLGPEEDVTFFHGLNGSYEAALALLQSEQRGVEERRGPTLSLFPLAQYWKPGDVGLRYSIPRRLVQFPGEEKPNAVVIMKENDIAFINTKDRTLPFTEFKGEVIRSPGTEPNPVQEERIKSTELLLNRIRAEVNYINSHVASGSKERISELLLEGQDVYKEFASRYVRDGIHEMGLPLKRLGIPQNMLDLFTASGKQLEGRAEFGPEIQTALQKITELLPQLELKRDGLVNEDARFQKELEACKKALAEVQNKAAIIWKIKPLARSFVEGLQKTYGTEGSGMKEIFTMVSNHKNPREFLQTSFRERSKSIVARQEETATLIDLYNKEIKLYSDLKVELQTAADMIRQAIETVQKQDIQTKNS